MATGQPLRIALAGAPNAGKTTLFNALTGASAHVGNYPGVTVERREGRLRHATRSVGLLDLPGTYTLIGETADEQVAVEVIDGTRAGEAAPDALLVVVDGTTLRRSLGLLAEILAHGRPTALVVTMLDEIRARGGRIHLPKLAARLGIPVAGVVGHRGIGLDRVRELLERPENWERPAQPIPATTDERFAWADAICDEVGMGTLEPDAWSDRIDRVLLHPVAGIGVFLLVMLLLFQSIFSWAVPAMDLIDGAFGTLGRLARGVLPAGILADFIADGLLAGLGAVAVFLPQIALLFLLIHLLQDVGYMARAAFVVDRIMGWVGLQGRSFVPLLSCYACAVPGIMAARAIASPRQRLATILVAPFMTCSARLPVYTLLIGAFIPAATVLGVGVQALVMLALYLVGALTAFGSAALLNKTLLRGTPSFFYMELPPYRMPTASLLARQVWNSASAFLKRAGKTILFVSMILWALLRFPGAPATPEMDAVAQAQANLHASIAAQVGRAVEPAIEPLGFDWKIGISLIASLAAREVVVSTLAQIYAVGDADDFDGLRTALKSPDPVTGDPPYTFATALSLLVFFVFALQCTSTVVVMARETGSWRWPALAFSYMLGLAWIASFVTYQVASRVT